MDAAITIGIVGGTYGLTLAAMLIGPGGARPLASRLLALLLLGSAIAITTIAVDHGFDSSPRAVEMIEIAVSLLAGPLLLGYTIAARDQAFRLRAAHAVHLLPSVAFVLTALASEADRFRGDLLIVQQAPYTLAALLVVLRAQRGRPEKDWSPLLVGSYLLLHVAQLFRTFGGELFRDIVPIAGALVLFAVGLVPWRRVHRVLPKYQRSALTEDVADDLLRRFETLLHDARLHRDPQLTLHAAAARLGVTPQALSQAVNQQGGATFAAVVTRHRLEDARAELLRRPAEEVKIEVLALEAGFASRSSFYDAFRKAYGTTPSRYRAAMCGVDAAAMSGTVVPDTEG